MKRNKTKEDPKAKVRNRGDVVVPASRSKDNKDHFPVNNKDQGQNALSRVNQYSKAPPWYKGNLSSLINSVYRKVKSKYPDMDIDKAKKKPGKQAEQVSEIEKLATIMEYFVLESSTADFSEKGKMRTKKYGKQNLSGLDAAISKLANAYNVMKLGEFEDLDENLFDDFEHLGRGGSIVDLNEDPENETYRLETEEGDFYDLLEDEPNKDELPFQGEDLLEQKRNEEEEERQRQEEEEYESDADLDWEEEGEEEEEDEKEEEDEEEVTAEMILEFRKLARDIFS